MSRVDLLRTVLTRSLNDAATNLTSGMIDEDKFYESSKTDSGFLSGGNLVVSGEIVSEELSSSSHTDNSNDKLKTPETEKVLMRLDSGVDLIITESLSNLSLEKNSAYNDLNSSNKPNNLTSTTSSLTVSKQFDASKEQPPWELYYEQDEDGDTLLHAAIVQRLQEVTLALIRAAPHPRLLDTPNDDADSPLHLAVATGQWRIVRWLIVAGAKPCPRNINGDSPLHLSARLADVQCCKAINDPVQQQERDALCLSYPPQPYQPSDLNQWNYDGQTCVHVAAIHGHLDILRHLYWYGADINAREGKSGYTALHYALERGDERLADFLLRECSSKLDATILTYGRRSVLEVGCAVSPHIQQVLLSRGVQYTTYSSDEEYDSDDSDDEIYENHSILQQQSMPINVTA